MIQSQSLKSKHKFSADTEFKTLRRDAPQQVDAVIQDVKQHSFTLFYPDCLSAAR